jgi:hypothetical protein
VPDFAVNMTVKKLCERGKELNQKVVMNSSQPNCRNFGKTQAKFCFKMKRARRKRMRKWAAKYEVDMNRIYFQRNGTEQECCAITCAYSPATLYLQAHYSLTVRRCRLIK